MKIAERIGTILCMSSCKTIERDFACPGSRCATPRTSTCSPEQPPLQQLVSTPKKIFKPRSDFNLPVRSTYLDCQMIVPPPLPALIRLLDLAHHEQRYQDGHNRYCKLPEAGSVCQILCGRVKNLGKCSQNIRILLHAPERREVHPLRMYQHVFPLKMQ